MFIYVDGVFFCLFFHFGFSIVFINLSNNLVIINMRSTETNMHNTRFHNNNTRSIVVNCSSGISMVVYRSIFIPFILDK
jgi:hypothetical protein